MRLSLSVAAARSVAVSTLTNQYFRRLLVSMLLTGFDGSVLLSVGRAVYEVASLAPWLTFAFLIMAIVLLISLTHIWYTTLRTRRAASVPQPQPEP
jgi:hypothetical protein